MTRLWRQDLVWALFILGLSALIGLVQQWPLVRQSWQGELAARIEQARSQRRQQEFQGVKTVNLAQAYDLFERSQALFIDARPAHEYAELHIAQARNITPEMLANGMPDKLSDIAKDRKLVVYCSQVNCDLALEVAEKLQVLGFTAVVAFMGGFRAWDEAGYPADTSN